jgi:uncharacterized protein YdiU (UPF0061 family)
MRSFHCCNRDGELSSKNFQMMIEPIFQINDDTSKQQQQHIVDYSWNEITPFSKFEHERKQLIEQYLKHDIHFDKMFANKVAYFNKPILWFRNNELLRDTMLLDDGSVTDEDFIQQFARMYHHNSIGNDRYWLVMRYHGYQFGIYNNRLGDGRALLVGQGFSPNGTTFDIGTKGSGRTMYSRGSDGKLTLLGGIREVLAGELLHMYGIRSQRTLCLIETGDVVYREDSNNSEVLRSHRGCLLVRVLQSSIRFGTFERLLQEDEKEYIPDLLNYILITSYPDIWKKANISTEEKYIEWYSELVSRTASLAAKLNAIGFVHGVLNTDNMSIAGEVIDFGPFGMIETYDPNFTSAGFDRNGRYSFKNQSAMCKWNLLMLQKPLAGIIPIQSMSDALEKYDEFYWSVYCDNMMKKLGFDNITDPAKATKLVQLTIHMLEKTQIEYQEFFIEIGSVVSEDWITNSEEILVNSTFIDLLNGFCSRQFNQWKLIYNELLQNEDIGIVRNTVTKYNPSVSLFNRDITRVWSAIEENNDWKYFYDLLDQIQSNNTMTN